MDRLGRNGSNIKRPRAQSEGSVGEASPTKASPKIPRYSCQQSCATPHYSCELVVRKKNSNTRRMIMKTIISALVALSVLSGVAATAYAFDAKSFYQEQDREHL